MCRLHTDSVPAWADFFFFFSDHHFKERALNEMTLFKDLLYFAVFIIECCGDWEVCSWWFQAAVLCFLCLLFKVLLSPVVMSWSFYLMPCFYSAQLWGTEMALSCFSTSYLNLWKLYPWKLRGILKDLTLFYSKWSGPQPGDLVNVSVINELSIRVGKWWLLIVSFS